MVPAVLIASTWGENCVSASATSRLRVACIASSSVVSVVRPSWPPLLALILSAEVRRAVRSVHTAGVLPAPGEAEEVPPLDEAEPSSLPHAENPVPSTSTQRTAGMIR